MNYFDFFDLQSSYIDIDLQKLESKYIEYQLKYNPEQKDLSNENKLKIYNFLDSINKAYLTLKNPVKRGEYILNLNGYSIFTDLYCLIKPTKETLDFAFKVQSKQVKVNIKKESINFQNFIDIKNIQSAGQCLLKINFSLHE